MKNKTLSIVEEIFNSVTHGIGAIISIIGLIILISVARDSSTLKITSFIIFGVSLSLMYVMSTLFHSLTFTKAKKVFFIFDQSSIFLLIAGTYTPILLLILHGWISWSLLLLVWSLAIFGVVFNSIFSEKYKMLFVPLYLLMGWIGVFIVNPLLKTSSIQDVWLLIIGGIFYTAGIVFFAWNKLPFNHTIWHLFVMGGSVCHFLIICNL